MDEMPMDVYLCLAETDSGRRYWRTSCDCRASVPVGELVAVRGPATVGRGGYETEFEAAQMLADGSLDPSGVGIVLFEDGGWCFEEEEVV